MADPVPVTVNQRFLLGPAPAFQLALGGKSLVAGGETVGPDKADRAAAGGVAAEASPLVLRQAQVDIIGVTGVI